MDKHFVGLNLFNFEDNGRKKPVSRVTIAVDDDSYLTAGDDTGLEMTARCPYATQEMVDALLNQLKGYQYQMYAADGANVDPAAELGDGFTAGGVYSVLSRIADNGTGRADAAAPGEGEAQDEFPTAGPLTESLNRQLTNARASITKNAANIELRVELNKVISSINLSPEEITIQAERLSLEGLVTINRTFQIDKQGYLRCNGGTIGGWEIGLTALYNGTDSMSSTTNGTYIGTDGIRQYASSNAYVNIQNGVVTARGANIKGTVSATSGTFDSVTIGNSTITGSSLGGTLNSPGGTLGSVGGTFTGTNSGSLTGRASSANLNSCSLNGTSLSTGDGNAYYGNNGNGSLYMYAASSVGMSGFGCTFNASSAGFSLAGGLYVSGQITTGGTKPRTMTTASFGKRQLDAYETPTPTFADYGTSRLDENGVCYISIDPIFSETVNQYYMPTVFLTKYGEGDVWFDDSDSTFNIVAIRGTPGLKFAWETRYEQANCDQGRLREFAFENRMPGTTDYDVGASLDLEHTTTNMEFSAEDYLSLFALTTTDYGAAGANYYQNFERSLSV